jgi:hypothetical protein
VVAIREGLEAAGKSPASTGTNRDLAAIVDDSVTEVNEVEVRL